MPSPIEFIKQTNIVSKHLFLPPKLKLTLTNPHFTRTPHPTKVIPLQRRGKRIPVDGSVWGASITGSAPIWLLLREAEHSLLLLVLGSVIAAAVAAVTAATVLVRKNARDSVDAEEVDCAESDDAITDVALATLLMTLRFVRVRSMDVVVERQRRVSWR